MPPAAPKLRLLVRHSAAEKDVALASELLRHLEVVQRFAGVDVWSDTRIRAGDDTRREIARAIDQADVALLLLSADLFASDGLVEVEVPRLLERHRAGKLRVIPVLLRSCLWEVHPWLKELHPLPESGKAIGSFVGGERDAVLTAVVRKIVGLATSGTTPSPNPRPTDKPSRASAVQRKARGGIAGRRSQDQERRYTHHVDAIKGLPVILTIDVALGPPTVLAARRFRKASSSMLQSTFISYGGPDTDVAQRLNDALLRNGVTTFFFAKDAIPGRKLHRLMREGVNQHDRVILVCSQASLDRPGVLNEITETLQREARDGGKEYLIPITLDDYVFSGWKPEDAGVAQAIRDRVVADFKGAETDPAKFNEGLLRLIAALKK